MGVNDAPRKMHERSGASRERLAGQREIEGTLENVKALVTVAMDVRRWTEFRFCRELCDCERSVGIAADHFEREQVSQQPERLPFSFAELQPALRE
jgi:hypothetical protein